MQLTAVFHSPKLLRVMRLTTILLLTASLHVAAKTEGQNVTLHVNNAPIKEVFREIQKQTGLNVMMDEALIEKLKPISLDVHEVPVSEVLNKCFQDVGLVYSIADGRITVKSAPAKTIEEAALNIPPPIDIHGRVTDSLGSPLAGASVTVKGSKRGTSTDANGNFELKGINDNTTLLISFTGYLSKQFKINGNSDVAVYLNKSNSPLDEIQVIAYGTQIERFSVGNVSTVKSDVIEKQPVANPLLALEGQVAGLFITQSNGVPGSAVTVRIQGQNSILNGNDPLYIIDGVPYTSTLLPNLGTGILGNGGTSQGYQVSGSPLNFINPADIERIDVLKDADATAIYGSRAANGAILITTKKGKSGPMKVDVTLQNGWGQITKQMSLLNTPQYLEMRHEALNNDGITPSLSNGDYDLLQWDTTRYTNWQKKLIGGTSQFTNVQTNISGGNASIQYEVGAGYLKETTVFPGDFGDQKGFGHFSLSGISLNQKFHVQFTANYTLDKSALFGIENLTQAAITLPPDAPPLYNTDGTLNWAPNASGTNTWPTGQNPLAQEENTYDSRTSNFITNALLSYELFPGMEIKSSFGYTDMQTYETNVTPLTAYDPSLWFIGSGLRRANYLNNDIRSWIIEPQATYQHTIGKGKLNVLIGSTIQQNNSQSQSISGNGYSSDLLLYDITSAASLTGQSLIYEYKYNALFSRINYNWSDEFLIDLTARRDGSSRFGPANQFHDFASAGAGWIFSKTAIFQNQLSFLSFGKLKASYGTTGNDQIGDYQFLDLYNSTNYSVPYQGINGLEVTRLFNPNLQWEETKKWQFGLDLGFLRDRILLNAVYYNNRTSNQLLDEGLPYTTGQSFISINLPATVQNSGWEFTVNTTNIKSGQFSWLTSFNLTIPINKLISFPGLAGSDYANVLSIGQPINILYVYHLIGVNDSTGTYKFSSTTDQNNPSSNDKTVIEKTAPQFYGGLTNTLNYKRFQLEFMFQFVKQKGPNYLFGDYAGSEGVNQPVSVLNRWRTIGDVAPIQRFNSDYSIYQQVEDAQNSDAAYTDASFIRLKNISLSWQMPEEWEKKAHMKDLSVFIHGQNLLTITSYKGSDPENLSLYSLPPLKILAIGIRATF